MNVGFVGVGAMGLAMAGHVRRGGFDVIANDVDAESLAKAQAAGLGTTDSLEDLARQTRIFIVVVATDAQSETVTQAIAAVAEPDSIIAVAATNNPGTMKALAAHCAERGIGFVDAPVSGGAEGARNGKLSIMVGGSAEDLDAVRPALEAYALRITHMGATGAGQCTKAVNQVLVAGINEAVCEGLALGEKLGLDPDKLLPTLGAGAAGNWFLDKRGASMLRREYVPGFKCAHLLKDLRIVLGMAQNAGVNTAVIEQALADYAQLVERGLGDADTSALIELKRQG